MNAYRRAGYAAAFVGIAVSMSACDDLTSLNENPNSPEDVTAEFLLPQSIRSGAELTYGAGMMLSHTGIFPQHAVQIQYPDEEQGSIRTATMDSYWSTYYSNSLSDIQSVVEKAQASGNANHEAIGLIWRSWLFHNVTDLWGDVPYSEALGGSENTTPAYDPQEDVYHGLLADLAAATDLLDTSGPGFGSADILYRGDNEGWRRFANSLRMRLAMRMVNADPARAQAEFVAAYEAGGFESNADNAALVWPGAPYENPLYENYLGRDDHGISGTMVDTLVSMNDPRLALYAEPAATDGEYRGHNNGYEKPPQALGFYSRIGNFWRADGSKTPSMIMTYSEVLFLLAEAAERGWINGNPADFYADGIEANLRQYAGLALNAPTDDDIAAYLANPAVTYDPAVGLNQIHLQQWIGLFMSANEAFAHWRRTGMPELTPGPDLRLERIPARFSYPGNEQSFNRTNLDVALDRQGGGNDFVTPLWWMP